MVTPEFVISVLASLAAALFTAFLIFEDWSLFRGKIPVTGYTRESWRGHPHLFLLLLAGACLLIGHFLWH